MRGEMSGCIKIMGGFRDRLQRSKEGALTGRTGRMTATVQWLSQPLPVSSEDSFASYRRVAIFAASR